MDLIDILTSCCSSCLDINEATSRLITPCVYLSLATKQCLLSSMSPVRSNQSDTTVRSTESVCIRQPAKSKIRRHNNNNRLSSVFNQSPCSGRRGQGSGSLQSADDPAELSSQMSVPGILKIFGSDICQGTHYKSVLATIQSSAKELVKEALERWEVSLKCRGYSKSEIMYQMQEKLHTTIVVVRIWYLEVELK